MGECEIPNPYFNEFHKVKGHTWNDLWHGGDLEHFVDKWGKRKFYTEKYAWAVPCDTAIYTISKLSPIIEIGAGSGYWAKLIEWGGGKITAYDKVEWDNLYFPVFEGGPETLIDTSYNCLFLCWPPYLDDMASDSLLAFNGKYVAYIGEDMNGCTADEAFHKVLAEAWKLVETVIIPQWAGLHDRLEIWERK